MCPFRMQQGVVCQIVPQQNYGSICKKYATAIAVPRAGKSNWVSASADGVGGGAGAREGRQTATAAADVCVYL